MTFSEDFLTAYPAFRGELSAGDRATGEQWFHVWQRAILENHKVAATPSYEMLDRVNALLVKEVAALNDRIKAAGFSGWIPVADCLPGQDDEVEAIIDYGGAGGESACRFQIIRTHLCSQRGFVCEAISSVRVTHWRPASPLPIAAANDYAGLNSLVGE